MNSSPKHILIVDDHDVVRYGIMLLIKELLPWAQISQVGSFPDAIEVVEKNKIDLVVLDINIPGGNNIQMLDVLERKQKGIKVLIFSAYDESLYALRYLQAGAKGYLYKQNSNNDVKLALQSVLNGGTYMSKTVKDGLINNLLNNNNEDVNPIDILSNREFEVAQMLIFGHGVTEISSSLNLQMSTVSTYKNRIFEKLKVDNIVQLIDKFRLWNITEAN